MRVNFDDMRWKRPDKEDSQLNRVGDDDDRYASLRPTDEESEEKLSEKCYTR